MLTNTTNKKGKEMRKKTMKMMIIAGAVALLVPTAAMAEWDQTETHLNQQSHAALFETLPSYGQTSAIGYDYAGDGTATLVTHRPFLASASAPWNTTPCPISVADPTSPSWADAMGNCPVQGGIADGNELAQTANGYAFGGDNEQMGVILDDLYQSLTEEASSNSNENNQPAYKKVDQVLDILFYRANTAGDREGGTDGWADQDGTTTWFGAFGFDQTLDQDVADIEGTSLNPVGTPFGQDLWAYNHMAQTFYQDFRMFDLGNTFNQATTGLTGNDSPRLRHGIELLASCTGAAVDCTIETDEWGLKTLEKEDFAQFDQWVIQSLRDDYTTGAYEGAYIGTATFYSTVVLEQSYSSWMVQGQGGSICDNVNSESITDGTCTYVYDKAGHAVDKSIEANSSTHQTGDP